MAAPITAPTVFWRSHAIAALYFSLAAFLILLPALLRVSYRSVWCLAPLQGLIMVLAGVVLIFRWQKAGTADDVSLFRAKLESTLDEDPQAPCVLLLSADTTLETVLQVTGITALKMDDPKTAAPFRVVAGSTRKPGGAPRRCGLIVWNEPENSSAWKSLADALRMLRGGEVPLHGVIVYGGLLDDKTKWNQRTALVRDLFKTLGVQCPVQVAVMEADLDGAVANLTAGSDLPATTLAITAGPYPPGLTAAETKRSFEQSLEAFVDLELPTRTLAAFGSKTAAVTGDDWRFPEQLDPDLVRQFRLASVVNTLWKDLREILLRLIFALRDEAPGADRPEARPYAAEFAVVPSWSAGRDSQLDHFHRVLDNSVWSTWSSAAMAGADQSTGNQRRNLLLNIAAVAVITLIQAVLIWLIWKRK